jgi:hypothetical protein
MNTGAKIAIGCGVVLLLGGIAVVVGTVAVGYWAKNKAEEVIAGGEQVERLTKQANENAFTPPADGVIREDRLVTFLNVRKQVYVTYEKYKDTLDAMSKKKEGDFSDVQKGFSIIQDLRLANAQALADNKMSETEYRFMVEKVYQAMIGSEITKLPSPSPNPDAPETATPPAMHNDVPAANLALFKKHEEDIRKYAMSGLEWVGL